MRAGKKITFTAAVVLVFVLLGAIAISDFDKIRPLYKAKTKAKPGDWLAEHKETHYTVSTYKNSHPVRPDSLRKYIYIYKLGQNTKAEDSLLQITCKYLEQIFHLKTKPGITISIKAVPGYRLRIENGKAPQVQTYFVLDTLVKLLPHDAAVAICFTKYDLYPAPKWNYVFGEAYLSKRVGVWSFYRYGNANTTIEFPKVLKRTLKVASHETGHMFSVTHCIRYECNMNGSNSLEEMDASTLHFCPDCLEKLSWNLGFALKPHLKSLQAFYTKQRMHQEATFIGKNMEYLKK